ncbi:hypothetical protein ACJIZ3_001973 [Penstemon smallii]|uniref:Glycine-rich protein n=1 Tax=Penstemon smallii TaxID=265156 RepID=A0ABD3U829_9LAMI
MRRGIGEVGGVGGGGDGSKPGIGGRRKNGGEEGVGKSGGNSEGGGEGKTGGITEDGFGGSTDGGGWKGLGGNILGCFNGLKVKKPAEKICVPDFLDLRCRFDEVAVAATKGYSPKQRHSET